MEGENKLSPGSACKNFCSYHFKGLMSVLIPLLCVPILVLRWDREFRCLFIICVMATYWITEVIPLYITSMLPIVLMPLLGILDSTTVVKQYFKDPLVMFLGGLMVALAIEYCNLHKRLALRTILIVGCSPRRLHFGLVFVAMFISFWISNSAATAMMCPIIKAVLNELDEQKVINIYMSEEEETPVEGSNVKHPSKIALAFYFGAAYATSIGGCATLIGTGTNITFKGIYETRFPKSEETLDFPIFMAYGVPLVLIDTFLMYIAMEVTHMGLFRPNSKEGIEIEGAKTGKDILQDVIIKKYDELGPMSMHEIQVGILFLLMIFLLFTMKPKIFEGWGDIMNEKVIKSSMPIMLVVFLMFVLPIMYTSWRYCFRSGPFTSKQTPTLLSWKYINDNTPWGLLFLLGGGFALAEGSKESGMAKMLGEFLKFLEVCPPAVVQFIAILIAIFMTAFSSNVAIANIIIPIFCELAVAIKTHPLNLVYPAGLACSMAFHLPVSTPPNAIISGYAGIKTKYMAAAGVLPSLICIFSLLLNGQTWHRVLYRTDSYEGVQ